MIKVTINTLKAVVQLVWNIAGTYAEIKKIPYTFFKEEFDIDCVDIYFKRSTCGCCPPDGVGSFEITSDILENPEGELGYLYSLEVEKDYQKAEQAKRDKIKREEDKKRKIITDKEKRKVKFEQLKKEFAEEKEDDR